MSDFMTRILMNNRHDYFNEHNPNYISLKNNS